MALSDQLALLLHVWREAFHVCSPHGRLRPPEDVRTELTRLFPRMAELDSAAMPNTRKPRHQPIDDMVVPFKHAETLDAELRAVVPHDV